jgi:hypothetical protein
LYFLSTFGNQNNNLNFRFNMKQLLLVFTTAILIFSQSAAQRIIYSEPNKDDMRQTNFEIIGRYGSNVLVYKNYRNKNIISAYDADMKEISRLQLDYLPEQRLINVDFISYPDYSWMVYQYQQKRIVYCVAVKLDATGTKVGNPIQLDTTDINYNSNSKLYSLVNSEDKQKIVLFKINNRNERRYGIKTLLFDKEMTNLRTSRIALEMHNRNDLLSDFAVDNQGNFFFGKGERTGSNDNVVKFFLVQKPADLDTFLVNPIKLENISLDDVKMKADNINNRYVITSFYYKAKKNIIEGIFQSVWDKSTNQEVVSLAIPLGDDIRVDAKGENNMKNAFNDYYLQQIILKKDGGFAIAAESLYTSSRGGAISPYSRWNYLSPYSSISDYYYYNRWSSWGGYPFSRWGGQITRYNADNVVILSFDKTGKLEWSNVIHKSQYDDEGEASISYLMVNTNDALRFLYNDFEKRTPLLAYQSIDPAGQITRNPTLRNLDKGYQFLPRYAKQTGQRQVIIPCLYRNYLTFARLDF